MAENGFPRILELPLVLLGLLVASPVLAVIAIAVRIDSPGPALFRQERVGRGGKSFVLLKFRSMRAGAGGSSVTAGGDPRVTRVGKILRRFRLDELPQLWNVVRNDMALVGPRPEVPRFVDLADPAAIAGLTALLDMSETIPMDARAYKFDIVLRGRRSTLFENRLAGN